MICCELFMSWCQFIPESRGFRDKTRLMEVTMRHDTISIPYTQYIQSILKNLGIIMDFGLDLASNLYPKLIQVWEIDYARAVEKHRIHKSSMSGSLLLTGFANTLLKEIDNEYDAQELRAKIYKLAPQIIEAFFEDVFESCEVVTLFRNAVRDKHGEIDI